MHRRYFAVCVLIVLLATPVQDKIEQASEKKSPFNKTDKESEKKSLFSGVWCVTKKYGWAVVLGVGVVFVELLAVAFYPIGMLFWHGGVTAGINLGYGGVSAVFNLGPGGAFANFQSTGASAWSVLKPAIWYRDWWMSMYNYIMRGCSENDMGCMKK